MSGQWPPDRVRAVSIGAAFGVMLAALGACAVAQVPSAGSSGPSQSAESVAGCGSPDTGEGPGRTRVGHTATQLQDGTVLVAGGGGLEFSKPNTVRFGPPLATAEIYDPRTGSWTPTGSMARPRSGHTATLLPDGSVLVAGGSAGDDPTDALATAERYDPVSGSWLPAGTMASTREHGHSATLLDDGRVLVAGGSEQGVISPGGEPYTFRTDDLRSSEIYDPGLGAWTPAGAMSQRRSMHTATALNDGTVLVTGGVTDGLPITDRSAERFDPARESWTEIPDLSTVRIGQSATLLADGSVLVAGGNGGGSPATAERFVPAQNRWLSAGSMVEDERAFHVAVRLPDGAALVLGGLGSALTSLGSVERYDPSSNSWAEVGVLDHGRAESVAVLLPTGGVLLIGGEALSCPLLPVEEFRPN